MASFRSFQPPPPSSSFVPPQPPSQAPLPPRPSVHPSTVSGAGHQYLQHGGFSTSAYGLSAMPYQFGNPPSGPQHNQQQYAYNPSHPSISGPSLSSSSYPSLPPLVQPPQPPHPQYYPSSQYPYYNPPPQPPPPPPPQPSSQPILNSSFPPPPPPPASPPPPPPPPAHSELSRKPSAPGHFIAPAPAPASTSFRHQKTHTLPPGKPLLQGPGKVETEEERNARKRREYEKQKKEERRQQMLKQSQDKVLQKTQMLAASSGGVRASARQPGSMVGSRLGDRRTAPFLASDRIENRLKKPTTFICKMK